MSLWAKRKEVPLLGSSIHGANSYDPWYVVCTKTRMESYAADALKDLLKLVVYLPQRKVVERGNRIKYVPFFPGYLFVQVDPQSVQPASIKACPGVLHLVIFDGTLEAVPHAVIETLYRKVCDLNRDGSFYHQFHPGDPVRIKEGSLQELSMIFLGYDAPGYRARTLISILGRMGEVQVDSYLLEKVPGEGLREKCRYSRGRGRRIRDHA